MTEESHVVTTVPGGPGGAPPILAPTSHGGFMGTSWENIGKLWKIRCKWRFKWENMI
jgi:hypothetical protein